MEKTGKMICFDMDGTIADLYAVPNWREMLDNEDATPYAIAAPMWDMAKLKKVCEVLMAQGWEIRVITWLSENATPQYKEKIRAAKWGWLAKYDFPLTHAHMVAYGTTKANAVRKAASNAILIDDNAQVRQGWKLGKTVNPETQDVITELWKLVA